MFTRTTRISDALAERPELRTLLPAFHPAFQKLSHPLLGKILPRLVTVEDAAKIAGVDVEAMLAVMNLPGAPAHPGPPPPGTRADEPVPEWLARAVDPAILDVRPALARGEEPFPAIMGALRGLPPGRVMTVLAPFEPAPLRRLLGERGWASHVAWEGETCRCSFWRAADGAVDAPADPGERLVQGADGWTLDVRGLEPPEPMRMVLAALDGGALPLRIHHHREPALLFPRLAERGLTWTVETTDDGVWIAVHGA